MRLFGLADDMGLLDNNETFDAAAGVSENELQEGILRSIDKNVSAINNILRAENGRFKPKWNTDKPAMTIYTELRHTILNEKKSKWKNPYHLHAMYCENEEDFELLRCYVKAVNSSPCDYRDIRVDGDFDGPDWYFPEKTTINYDMGARETVYWLETLESKKNKFTKFLKEFEEK